MKKIILKRIIVKQITFKYHRHKLMNKTAELVDQVYKISNYIKERYSIDCDLIDYECGKCDNYFENTKETTILKFIKFDYDSKN